MKQHRFTLGDYLQDKDSQARITKLIEENFSDIRKLGTPERLKSYAASVYNWFFRECISYNQFSDFTGEQCQRIFSLYETLLTQLREIPPEELRSRVDPLVENHRRLLLQTIDRSFKTRPNLEIRKVCAEYSAETQMAVLRIDPEKIPEPILDVGCGEQALFLAACLAESKEAFGIDYFVPKVFPERIQSANWLEYDFGKARWAMVVSHMAFTNHFVYHLTAGNREAGAAYARAYRAILESLKSGGRFCYCPAVPEAESALKKKQYTIKYFDNLVRGINIPSVRVEKLF